MVKFFYNIFQNEKELDGMTSMFKNMDNATIKSMMQMQGMSMSDDQINLMKTSINPQIMKMAASNNPPPSFLNNNPNNITTSTPSQNIPISEQNQENNLNNEQIFSNNNQKPNIFPTGGFPDMANMDMGSMMDFMQKNPQIMNMMGPQMSKMFGGNGNGNGNMDPNLMMNTMQTILWVFSIPSRIKQFFSSLRGRLLILFIIILIIAYIYK